MHNKTSFKKTIILHIAAMKNNNLVWWFFLCFQPAFSDLGGPYTLISKIQTECELEALSYGTKLADSYNNFDEQTEWDMRIHNDYITEHLGFAGWIQTGLWKSGGLTAGKQNAPTLQRKGGFTGSKNISSSSFWSFDNKWIYMMGDSTQRQVWATFVSSFQANDFERNAKEWTRENCARQFPHRKEHPSGGHFPEEGWGGKCGNNEVTCHLSGFGSKGKISFDWKHFPWEDYDQWLFGESGRWRANSTAEDPFPDVLVIQVGLHTCVHSWSPNSQNLTMIENHERDVVTLMRNVRVAIDRTPPHLRKTTVVIQTAGRMGNSDARGDHCTWRFNRILASEGHKQGFVVLEREEIERRLLFKSEYYPNIRYIKPNLHIENPSANIVGSSLLALVACLERNGTNHNYNLPPVHD